MKSVAPRSAAVRIATTLISLVVIVGSVIALIMVMTGTHTTVSGRLAQERSEASSVANAFLSTVLTYDRSMLQGSAMPTYRAGVTEFMTPKYAADFLQKGAPTAERAVALAGIKQTAQIWSTGVAAISADRATVLVVGAITDAVPTKLGGTDYKSQGETPFRTVVTLVKVSGTWRVDSQVPAEGVPPTAPPSASAVPKTTSTPAPSSGASR